MLEASYGHKIYYKTYGNPSATPIVFIHGGPGGKCLSIHKTFFDFDSWFVIFSYIAVYTMYYTVFK